MEYRKLPHGEEQISVIGLGCEYIHETSKEDIRRTFHIAVENGVNYLDTASYTPVSFPIFGHEIEEMGIRNRVYIQMHFGEAFRNNQDYEWTQDFRTVRRSFRSFLKMFHTDYTDMGYAHCLDCVEDCKRVLDGPIWDYMKGLKKDGVIRHLGLSAHTVDAARMFLDTGEIDMMMFSINPVYDYSLGSMDFLGDASLGSPEDRQRLYRDCEKEGVGIAVMKTFAGGQLLDDRLSPLGKALTKNQCIQYALDRPAVLTVLPGVRNSADLKEVLKYLDAPAAERDYSGIARFVPKSAEGNCVYCNHCQPCPGNLNVGLINKYYDLARTGDALAAGHYKRLDRHAADCLMCGHCESRCPFHVRQMDRMTQIATYFGR